MHDIGVLGLGVMGENLARNAARAGWSVAVHNRTYEKTESLVARHGAEGLTGYETLKDFIDSLKAPRRVLIMVKAGAITDMVADQIAPLLDKGDIMIDGGNSLFSDTVRREKAFAEKGINWFGMGVSGGEEGALHGPSMMPGGEKSVWEFLSPILKSMAAKDFSGGECVEHIGPNGAGHYVKMVHNGIEYAIMQLLAEAYELMKNGYGMSEDAIADAFEEWNSGPLQSFLFEIMIPILRKKDADGAPLLEKVLDTAGQKGTGRWTVIDAFERGVDVSMIAQAVIARVISSQRDQREKLYQKRVKTPPKEIEKLSIKVLGKALHIALLMAYAQGFELMKAASKEHNWELDFSEISRVWQGGCIIRSRALTPLQEGFKSTQNMLEIESVMKIMNDALPALQQVVASSVACEVPIHCFSVALSSFLGQTQKRSSAVVLQGLRDYFGAHTYQRIDKEGIFHTDWDV